MCIVTQTSREISGGLLMVSQATIKRGLLLLRNEIVYSIYRLLYSTHTHTHTEMISYCVWAAQRNHELAFLYFYLCILLHSVYNFLDRVKALTHTSMPCLNVVLISDGLYMRNWHPILLISTSGQFIRSIYICSSNSIIFLIELLSLVFCFGCLKKSPLDATHRPVFRSR
jgi:hypothetical protein